MVEVGIESLTIRPGVRGSTTRPPCSSYDLYERLPVQKLVKLVYEQFIYHTQIKKEQDCKEYL